MALDDMLIEEFGIGPIWVRRGGGAGGQAEAAGETNAQLPARDVVVAQTRDFSSSARDVGEDFDTRRDSERGTSQKFVDDAQARNVTPSKGNFETGRASERETSRAGAEEGAAASSAVIARDTRAAMEDFETGQASESETSRAGGGVDTAASSAATPRSARAATEDFESGQASEREISRASAEEGTAASSAAASRDITPSANAAFDNSRAPLSAEKADDSRTAAQANRLEDAHFDLETQHIDSNEDLPWTDDEPAPAPPVDAEIAEHDVPTLDWPTLEARVSNCQRCRLCERRTNTVFGVGDREADWMLIGEAPGENEDKQGEPFVGQAGKLLDNMLRALALSRESNVYIANVIKCRPPGNRNPELDEVARCEPYLQRQVELVKPKVIVALGRFAAQSLLKSDGSIASMRGRIHEYQGVPVVVTYHPAYLLRSLPDKAKAWADLCLARGAYRDALAKLGVEPSSSTAKQVAR